MMEKAQRYTVDSYGRRSNNEYLNFLEDKKIVLIGPSEYLVGLNLGSFFDEFDLIVRMNLSCPTPKNLHKDIGGRTDILYHVLLRASHCDAVPELFKDHTTEDIIIWKNDGVKWVVVKLDITADRTKKFAKANKKIIPWLNVPPVDYRQLKIKLGTPPNMGTIAISHMLSSKLKELHVYGCDFHMSGYHVGYGGFNAEQAKNGIGGHGFWGQRKDFTTKRPHKIDPQLKHLARLHDKDKRFKPDDVLKKLLGAI
jgi:hypothetical protein